MRANLIVIRTDKVQAQAVLYSQILGLAFTYHRHGTGPYHYSVQLEKTIFEIYPLLKNQKEPDNTLRLGFDIAHLDALIINLKKSKIEILKEPFKSEWGYIAIIKDLDGRKIELKEV